MARRANGPELTSSGWKLVHFMLAAGVLVYVWRIHDVFTQLRPLRLAIVSMVVSIAAFAASPHVGRLPKVFSHPIVRYAFAILALMLASVPFSLYPGLAGRYIVDDHIKTLLLVVMLVASIRTFRDVERLVLVQLIGAGIYCYVILSRFSVGASGRLGNLIYYDSNDLGLLLACSLPFAVYMIGSSRKLGLRLLTIGLTAVFLVAIVKTGSRGGFLAVLAVGLFLLFRYNAVRFRTRALILAAATFGFSLIAGPQYWDSMRTMLNPKADYNWSGNNDAGRMEVWKRGMGYMADRPILGVGVRNFTVAEGTISPIASRQDYGVGVKWSAAHNSFVEIGAELGVPGLILFVLLLWSGLAALRRIARSAAAAGWDRVESLAQAFEGSLVAYLVAGFFLSQAYSAYLYITLGVITGFSLVIRAALKQQRSGGRFRHA